MGGKLSREKPEKRSKRTRKGDAERTKKGDEDPPPCVRVRCTDRLSGGNEHTALKIYLLHHKMSANSGGPNHWSLLMPWDTPHDPAHYGDESDSTHSKPHWQPVEYQPIFGVRTRSGNAERFPVQVCRVVTMLSG